MNQYSSLKDIVLGDSTNLAMARPSALNALNKCNRRLEKLLVDLRSEQNAQSEVLGIARDVMAAVQLNPDVALACIFLSQIAGTYAVRHCIETSIVAILVAQRMRKTQEEMLVIAAASLTMNVGMLRHQNTFNTSSRLTSEEMSIVRRHPEESVDLLRDAGVENEDWISCVLMHHENDDGSGYPEGRTSADITQNARLISLADRYCAQVSARNYRCSVLPDKALHNLLGDPARVSDAQLADQFIGRIGKYPPGALVRLQNGEIGVVTQRDGSGEIHIHCLRDANGKSMRDASGLTQALRRASDPECAIAEVLSEDQADVRFSMKQIWGEQASL
ncbi:HD domain-containing protein [Pseudoduganella sp. LjRoot289]|uniref:HD-GYP domain-containing protein n=1 Tax=Pseudoduganella sp. LjRoot289 TaxID=3342314 RepID=UPI003ECDFD05